MPKQKVDDQLGPNKKIKIDSLMNLISSYIHSINNTLYQ